MYYHIDSIEVMTHFLNINIFSVLEFNFQVNPCSSSAVPGNMCNEYIELEQQLRSSEALQIQLIEERNRMHQSLQNQQTELEEK